ncbi:class I SAM-dependent methyltransferase [Pelagibacteraceae bacterium]|nr:class I SAM-dependent methyltransferase [Pelagibacteraceae bacterium]
MKNIYKNKSFYNRILDKFERRNRGNLLLILNNYFFYFKAKIKKISTDKRSYILEQLDKNSKIVEVGVWKGDFSKQIWNISSPNLLVLVDSWKFDEKVRGCAPQVSGEEPLNQHFFDQAKKDTYDKFKNVQNVNILDLNSLEASSKYEDNFFDYIYIDAEHTYKAVTKDLEVWYPKLKKNGTLFGDDYYWREEDDTLSLHIAYQEFIKKNHIKKWCVFKSQIKIIKDE